MRAHCRAPKPSNISKGRIPCCLLLARMSDDEGAAPGTSQPAKRGRPSDPNLEHFTVAVDHGNSHRDLKCKFCNKTFTRCKTVRARAHLAGVSGHGIAACPHVSSQVRAEAASTFTSSNSSKDSRAGSGGPTRTIEACVRRANSKVADSAIADFFFQNSIPFNVANTKSYEMMIKALTAQPVSYSRPSAWRLANPLLDAKYKSVQAEVCCHTPSLHVLGNDSC